MALSSRRGRMLLVAFGLVAGCAKIAPPPGGPIDNVGPLVLDVEPESLAVGVPVGAPIRIRFSEAVDPVSLERALWVTPGGAAKPRIERDGETATIRLGRPLPDSTTVAVLLTTVLKDRRREGTENRLAVPARWIFTTGDTLWPGRVHGTVERVGISPGQGPVLVALYAEAGDSLPDPVVADPLAVAEADTAGSYDLSGLRVDGSRQWLFALYDRDGNREIGGAGEFASAVPETVILTPGKRELLLPLRLVDPKAPATLTGTLVKDAPDTVILGVELLAADADSAALPVKGAQAGKSGSFSLASVPPGAYRLLAYCDLDRNGRRDPGEPISLYGEILLAPGSRRELGQWHISSCLP